MAKSEIASYRFVNKLKELSLPVVDRNMGIGARALQFGKIVLAVPLVLLYVLTLPFSGKVERDRKAKLEHDIRQLESGLLPDRRAQEKASRAAAEAMMDAELDPSELETNARLPGSLVDFWAHYGLRESVLKTDHSVKLLAHWINILYGANTTCYKNLNDRLDRIASRDAEGLAALRATPGVMGITVRHKPVTDLVAELSAELGPYRRLASV
jgi:hypothetical protein